MGRMFAVIGAVNAALAIMAAAFGAHGLEARLAAELITARQLNAFETGADHHLYSGIALLLIGLARGQTSGRTGRSLPIAGWLFIAGILMFSGSLYLYGMLGIKALIWITPIGGLGNILGWLMLAVGLYRAPRRD